MFTEEALEINKNVSASISTFNDDEGEQYFFSEFQSVKYLNGNVLFIQEWKNLLKLHLLSLL